MGCCRRRLMNYHLLSVPSDTDDGRSLLRLADSFKVSRANVSALKLPSSGCESAFTLISGTLAAIPRDRLWMRESSECERVEAARPVCALLSNHCIVLQPDVKTKDGSIIVHF